METRDKWLEWRAKGIGSSDAPIIMGVSPWKTRRRLWEEKTGRATPDKTNWAQQKGIDLEPVARANYELQTGLDMKPLLCEHAEYPFLRASLDGFNKDANKALEIKCPGKKDHETAVSGNIPEKYYPQLMHLILVSGASSLDYYSFKDGIGVTISVSPDMDYIKRLMVEEFLFYGMMVSDYWKD